MIQGLLALDMVQELLVIDKDDEDLIEYSSHELFKR